MRKVYVRGSGYLRYIGNGIVSGNHKKVLRFVDPRSSVVDRVFKKL